MRVHIQRVVARLRSPFVSATGTVSSAHLILLRLETADGLVGTGEAVCLGIPSDEVMVALEDCREVLGDSDGEPLPEVLAACADLAVLPQAVAAVDLALLDLAGRRARVPVWQVVGGESAPAVPVNATIAAPDRAGAAAAAATARADGFSCVKVKVGLGDDAGRLAAVRAVAGADMAIRLDANGAWSVPEAVASLRALAPVGLELCEEPASGVDAIATVAEEVPDVAIALDESAALPGALDSRACRAVCLKLSRSGGVLGLIDAARRARAAGYEVYLASMLDGPLGIAGALHAAAVIRPDRWCGLATLGLFDGRVDVLPARAGALAVPSGPGLGDGLIDWYAA
ncbi:MAG: mandelate racemase/muconate lactonizing enzyme family protein [Solirubrobacteraceae bacterium]